MFVDGTGIAQQRFRALLVGPNAVDDKEYRFSRYVDDCIGKRAQANQSSPPPFCSKSLGGLATVQDRPTAIQLWRPAGEEDEVVVLVEWLPPGHFTAVATVPVKVKHEAQFESQSLPEEVKEVVAGEWKVIVRDAATTMVLASRSFPVVPVDAGTGADTPGGHARIDDLVKNYWTVEAVCSVGAVAWWSGARVKRCREAEWSAAE
jgi:hypothetical protein